MSFKYILDSGEEVSSGEWVLIKDWICVDCKRGPFPLKISHFDEVFVYGDCICGVILSRYKNGLKQERFGGWAKNRIIKVPQKELFERFGAHFFLEYELYHEENQTDQRSGEAIHDGSNSQ